MAAYSLGEIGEHVAVRLWQAARVALAVIDRAAARVCSHSQSARGIVGADASMAAPCPAATPCPLAAPDWCHFAARVERSSMHRRVKDAELGYEDEKSATLPWRASRWT